MPDRSGTGSAAVRLRRFVAADAPALARLFHDSVHVIGARHYTPAQRAAWSPAPADPAHWLRRAGDGRTTLVAVDADDGPLAYGDLEADGHLDHLYCRPDHAGTGVAALLYRALEQIARERGVHALSVEASEPARRFFARQGFALVHRQEVSIGGVALHRYLMSKPLA